MRKSWCEFWKRRRNTHVSRNAKEWYLLPKGKRREGPYSLTDLVYMKKTIKEQSGLKFRKGKQGTIVGVAEAFSVYPDLFDMGILKREEDKTEESKKVDWNGSMSALNECDYCASPFTDQLTVTTYDINHNVSESYSATCRRCRDFVAITDLVAYGCTISLIILLLTYREFGGNIVFNVHELEFSWIFYAMYIIHFSIQIFIFRGQFRRASQHKDSWTYSDAANRIWLRLIGYSIVWPFILPYRLLPRI